MVCIIFTTKLNSLGAYYVPAVCMSSKYVLFLQSNKDEGNKKGVTQWLSARFNNDIIINPIPNAT